MEKITKEQIQAKTDELAAKFDCDILPIELVDPKTEEQLVAYVREPELELVQKAIDLFSADRVSEARQLIFDIGLVKEESHARFFSGNKKDKKVVLGAQIACTGLITFYVNQYKKK